MFYSFHSSEDIFEDEFIDVDELDTGGHIETQIYYLLGGMEIENHLLSNIGPALYSAYYYYVPISGKDGNTYFICVEGDSDDTEMYEQIITNTWLFVETSDMAYLNDPVDFEGTISKIDNDVHDEIKSHFREVGFYTSNSDVDKYVLSYVLEPVNFSMAPVYIIALIILVVGAIAA